jgi:hypothetical protein
MHVVFLLTIQLRKHPETFGGHTRSLTRRRSRNRLRRSVHTCASFQFFHLCLQDLLYYYLCRKIKTFWENRLCWLLWWLSKRRSDFLSTISAVPSIWAVHTCFKICTCTFFSITNNFFFVSLTPYIIWIRNFSVHRNIWDRMLEKYFGIFMKL